LFPRIEQVFSPSKLSAKIINTSCGIVGFATALCGFRGLGFAVVKATALMSGPVFGLVKAKLNRSL